MQANPRFWVGKRVCVTGGTGFLGWHLVQQLLPLAGHVRILGLAPRCPDLWRQLEPLDCILGDVRDPFAVRAAVYDADVVFHAAGPTSTWGPGLQLLRDIHVNGTEQVLRFLPADARMVHTSSVTTIGASADDRTLTEASPFNLQDLRVDYVQAKRAAEETALSAARCGVDVTVVNPGYLFGPDDYEESVMGRICVRYWRGKVPMIPPGGINCVDVRDVALGHLLAAEMGQRGERYILGGENLTMAQVIRGLAPAANVKPRWLEQIPDWLFGALACFAELRGYLLKREPYPSLQCYRLSRLNWYYSSDRARAELGYHTRPFTETLADMYTWACRQGYPLDGQEARRAWREAPRQAA